MAHHGKTALVTGGSSGLGRAIAETFLNEGARVVICDINQELLADFREKVSSAHPDRTLVVECNITSDSALDDLFAQAAKQFGHLDYVINCAGIMDKFAPVVDMERETWDRVIATNLTAPTMVTQRAVKMMLEMQVHGSIVNITAVAGFRGYIAGTAYTASKHGLIGLTRNTGSFYGEKGIRANAIAAGQMRTRITDAFSNGIDSGGVEMLRSVYPTISDDKWYIDPKKIAKLAVYLCSDDADMINGAIYTVDKGLTVP